MCEKIYRFIPVQSMVEIDSGGIFLSAKSIRSEGDTCGPLAEGFAAFYRCAKCIVKSVYIDK